MRTDLQGMINNALERGEKLEEVIKTLISAGYPEDEIREASKGFNAKSSAEENATTSNPQASPKVTQGMPILEKPSPPKLKKSFSFFKSKNKANTKSIELKTKKQKISIWAIILFIILIFLIGFFVFSLIFRDQIIAFLK